MKILNNLEGFMTGRAERTDLGGQVELRGVPGKHFGEVGGFLVSLVTEGNQPTERPLASELARAINALKYKGYEHRSLTFGAYRSAGEEGRSAPTSAYILSQFVGEALVAGEVVTNDLPVVDTLGQQLGT